MNVVFYESGKLVVQGKGTQEFIEFVLEPEILREAKLGYEAVLNPELLAPRLGVDESGKGDFFGSLCVAGVYVNEQVIGAWKDAGIRDSKNISSDRKIKELAELIRDTPGCVSNVVPIGNEAYNRLYTKMRSVNTLLAWGHARLRAVHRGCDELRERRAGRRRDRPERGARRPGARPARGPRLGRRGVAARSPRRRQAHVLMPSPMSFIREELTALLDRAPYALTGWAAASILARHEFVTRLAALEKQFEVDLPKGASSAVDKAAKEFIARHGVESLPKVAKMHFRTALRAQGLPEPPKTEWKKRSG